MGIFKRGKPDPNKRKPGYGVLEVYPYLFSDTKEFFKELRKEFLEYLSEEEEEVIINHFQDESRSFRCFVPEKEFNHVQKKMAAVYGDDAPFNNFGIRIMGTTMDDNPGDYWLTDGRYGGIIATEEVKVLLQRVDIEDLDESVLKNYFIISNCEAAAERKERERANTVARASVDGFDVTHEMFW